MNQIIFTIVKFHRDKSEGSVPRNSGITTTEFPAFQVGDEALAAWSTLDIDRAFPGERSHIDEREMVTQILGRFCFFSCSFCFFLLHTIFKGRMKYIFVSILVDFFFFRDDGFPQLCPDLLSLSLFL